MTARPLPVLVVVALLGGAVAVDAIRPSAPASPPRPVRANAGGGVLACPHALVRRGAGWVYLANVGEETSQAVVTFVREKGKQATMPVAVPAGTVRTVAVHDRIKGPAATIIEYAGGELVASHKTWVPRKAGGPGAGAAACARAPAAAEVAVAGMWTLRAEARLALANPGTAPADVTIALIADGRRFDPVRLRRQVVPPRALRSVRLGDFVFDKRNVVAVVRATAGRVIVEGLLTSRGGVSLHAAQAPSSRAIAISGGSGDGAVVALASTGENDTGLEGRVLASSTQGKAPRVPASLEPAGGARVGIPSRNGDGPAAYALSVAVGGPVVATTTWRYARRAGTDRASVDAGEPVARWAAVTGGMPARSATRLILVNPGDTAVRARIRPFGKGGPIELSIGPGRLVARTIHRGSGATGAEITADGAIVVAVSATGRGAAVHAQALLATPLPPPNPVGVVVDPRAGITAPLSGR